ncbi:potassium-transporting ATPase subunit KdpA [Burkholderiaceae bacterium DAT-1]|nr:potassium-transporting ATPase subunit KdpA [Burkholderiaceae bacterium DAT-1]
MHNALIQYGLYVLVLLLLTKPMGLFIAAVMRGEQRWYTRPLRPLEKLIYGLGGIDEQEETGWKPYAIAFLAFNLLGALVLYGLQRLQGSLPLNLQQLPGLAPDLSFNTAISFITNTNWQAYGGESTMSYLTQMLGLTVQNFLSAASGIVVAIALIRGFARKSSATIGHFWVDVTRATVYILLPGSLILATLLMGQGVIQNFAPYQDATTLEISTWQQPKHDAAGNPVKDAQGNPVLEDASSPTQSIAMGPVASQEAIKMLGTNGGGFFNANSSHPYENPTPLSNFLQMLAIFIIPAGLVYAFGEMVGDRRQGWAVFAAMGIIFLFFLGVCGWAEQAGNPAFASLHIDQTAGAFQAGGNMEGKETRFGIVATTLFATITTSASCGAVNAMHDSFTPIGGLVPMWLMQLGEVIFGGVGSGLYVMLIYAVIAVFIAGLMIGRTPEYVGKKIEAFDIKMSSVVILVTPLLVLAGAAIAVMTDAGRAGIANPGAHGFSEILYAFSSAANNNGSAFAGLSANTPFYNVMLAIAMFFGRFWPAVAVLAIAGNLAAKKRIEAGAGTLPTHGPLFVCLLIGSVVLVGALTYVPALALGPVVEQLQMISVK